MDCDCLVDCQGAHSHKEGQEDQGEVKELRGHLIPRSFVPSFWPSSHPRAFKIPLKAFKRQAQAHLHELHQAARFD